MSKPNALCLLVDSHHGIYVPKVFSENFDHSKWQGIPADDLAVIANPEHEWYWEAWDSILRTATCLQDGHTYRLHQDGDLWAYCDELMSDEEYKEFWGEARD